jgi:hypothetical protein
VDRPQHARRGLQREIGQSMINNFLISIVMISLKRNHRHDDLKNNLDFTQILINYVSLVERNFSSEKTQNGLNAEVDLKLASWRDEHVLGIRQTSVNNQNAAPRH